MRTKLSYPVKPGLAVAAVAALVAAQAAPAAPQLNDTGITACIDGAGGFLACEGTGQDGAFGRDLTHPGDADGRLGFRFTRLCNSGEPEGRGRCPTAPSPGDGTHDWGCTRDGVTGLVWEVKTANGPRAGDRSYSQYSPTHDPVGRYGQPGDATGYVHAVNAAGLCGAHDWRLPSPAELVSIVDMGIDTLPPVDTRFLGEHTAGTAWAAGTVTTGVFANELGWTTNFAFNGGSVTAQFRSGAFGVRLVRGAQPGALRYAVLADGQAVRDRATGLVWRRCAEGLSFDGAGCAGQPLRLDWADALARARQQARDTGVAWRLPNAKELASLLVHDGGPHIDAKAFPDRQAQGQWTSSPVLIYQLPRCVSFVDGTTGFCNLGTPLGLRLVRDNR